MTEENKKIFFNHAIHQTLRECCALLIIEGGKEKIIICKNISEYNHHQFVIDPVDYAAAEDRGQVVGVVHSHPNGTASPSEADRVACEQTKVPWHIFGLKLGDWVSITPSGYRAPLVGRQWSHGILDCYSLVRDYYAIHLGLEIPDYDRKFEWWLKGEDLYEKNFREAGFFEIDPKDIKKHDGIMMQVNSPVINHAGVYLGNQRFIHHLYGRLSGLSDTGAFYEDD